MTAGDGAVGRGEWLATTVAAWASRGAFLGLQILALSSFAVHHGDQATTLLAWCQGLSFLGFVADGGVCNAFQAAPDGVQRIRGYLTALVMRGGVVWGGSAAVLALALPASHPVHGLGGGGVLVALVALVCVLAAPSRLMQVLWVRRRRGWVGHGLLLVGCLLGFAWIGLFRGAMDPLLDLLAVLVLPCLPSVLAAVVEGFARPEPVGHDATLLVSAQAAMGFADAVLPAWVLDERDFSAWTMFQRLTVFLWYPAMAALATISIREPRKIFSACSPGRMGIVSGLGFAGVLVLAALPAPTMPVFGVDAPLWLLGAAGFAAVLRVALDATSSALVSMGRLRDAALMAFMVLIFFMMGVLVLTRLALPGPAAPVLALLVGVGAAVAWSVVRFQRLGVADRAGRGR
jgi:hypothetical protein